jgi:hypothetical protein
VPFSECLFNTLDPVLQEVGREAEDAWERALRARGLEDLTRVAARPHDARSTPWEEFRAALAALPAEAPAYGREVEIGARVGAFEVSGRIDFFVILWDQVTPRVRLVEGKASRKDRTYHRIQLAAYVVLLRRLLQAAPLQIGGHEVDADAVEGTVVRIDEVTNEPQDMIERPALNLDTEIADLERLLAGDGLLAPIVDRDLDALEYQLNAKCDG